jgi:hypothetical protein
MSIPPLGYLVAHRPIRPIDHPEYYTAQFVVINAEIKGILPV